MVKFWIYFSTKQQLGIHLTHCDSVIPYVNIDLGQHWVRLWLGAWWHQDIAWTNFDFSWVKSCGINTLATGRCGKYFKSVTSEHMLWIKLRSVSCDVALRWMPQNTFDDKSTLVKEMPYCLMSTSHSLNQWWPRSMSPYGVIWFHWAISM